MVGKGETGDVKRVEVTCIKAPDSEVSDVTGGNIRGKF